MYDLDGHDLRAVEDLVDLVESQHESTIFHHGQQCLVLCNRTTNLRADFEELNRMFRFFERTRVTKLTITSFLPTTGDTADVLEAMAEVLPTMTPLMDCVRNLEDGVSLAAEGGGDGPPILLWPPCCMGFSRDYETESDSAIEYYLDHMEARSMLIFLTNESCLAGWMSDDRILTGTTLVATLMVPAEPDLRNAYEDMAKILQAAERDEAKARELAHANAARMAELDSLDLVAGEARLSELEAAVQEARRAMREAEATRVARVQLLESLERQVETLTASLAGPEALVRKMARAKVAEAKAANDRTRKENRDTKELIEKRRARLERIKAETRDNLQKINNLTPRVEELRNQIMTAAKEAELIGKNVARLEETVRKASKGTNK